jgi:hypothetical protein
LQVAIKANEGGSGDLLVECEDLEDQKIAAFGSSQKVGDAEVMRINPVNVGAAEGCDLLILPLNS